MIIDFWAFGFSLSPIMNYRDDSVLFSSNDSMPEKVQILLTIDILLAGFVQIVHFVNVLDGLVVAVEKFLILGLICRQKVKDSIRLVIGNGLHQLLCTWVRLNSMLMSN